MSYLGTFPTAEAIYSAVGQAYRVSVADSLLASDAVSYALAHWFKVPLEDVAKLAELFYKAFSKGVPLADYLVAEYAIAALKARELRDLLKALDSLSFYRKLVQELRDGAATKDLLAKGVYLSLQDAAKALDLLSKSAALALLDLVFGEHALSKTPAKSLLDEQRLADYVSKVLAAVLLVLDLAGFKDLVAKAVSKSLADYQKLADALAKSLARTLEVLDSLVAEHVAAKSPSLVVRDEERFADYASRILALVLAVLDLAGFKDLAAKGASKLLADGQRLSDAAAYSVAKVLALLDRVAPEHVFSKGIPARALDALALADLPVRWLATVFGFALELLLLGDVLMDYHFNNAASAMKATLDEAKKAWSMVTSDPYPASFSDAEASLAKLPKVKIRDEVRAEHVNNLMKAASNLYRAVDDLYFKYKLATGRIIPMAEKLLEEARKRVYEAKQVYSGDVIMPEDFLQVYEVALRLAGVVALVEAAMR